MTFKKIVSAASALTIAASAFVSLAVTANAADYVIDEVLYGVNTDGVVTAQTDFEGTNAATKDSVYNGTNFLEGSALNLQLGAITKDFTEPISSGKVHFSASYTVVGGQTSPINLVDSNGASVVSLYPVDSRNSGTINVLKIGNDSVSNYIYTPRSVAYKLNDLTIDFDSKTYSYNMTLCTGGASGTVNKVDTITGNGLLDGVKDIKGLSAKKQNNDCYIDNLCLYNEKSSSQLYNYKINYKLGEETVKTASADVPAGTTITAESVFTENNQKYFITAETAPTLEVTADGTNTLDVSVRKANTYTATVTANYGDKTKTLSSTEVVEGETWNYNFPVYLQDGSTVYEVANNNSDPYYGGSVADVTAEQNITLTYNKATYENVVLYDELDGSTGNGADKRASNCSAYDNKAYTSSSNLEPGIYTVYVRCSLIGRGSTLSIGDQTILSEDKTNSWRTYTIENVTVTEAAPLVWNAGGSKTYDPIDTVLVVKTGDVATTSDKAYSFKAEEGSDDKTYSSVRVLFTEGDTQYKSELTLNTQITVSSTDSVFLKITEVPENVTVASVELY